MSYKARIALAEAMDGVVVFDVAAEDPFSVSWNGGRPAPWNPFTDANDCEALVRWLQEKGYDIEIWWSGTAFTHRSNVHCRAKLKYRSDMYWATKR